MGTVFEVDSVPATSEIRSTTIDSPNAASRAPGHNPYGTAARRNGVGNVRQFTAHVLPPPHAGFRAVPRYRTVVEFDYVPLSKEEQAEQKELNSLIETLTSEKPAEQKAEAKKKVSAILEKQFNVDIERREKEVTELEARVKKLRDQVDKRKAAKDEIVNLRLNTIQNEADGLGFPDVSGGPRAGEFRPSVPAPIAPGGSLRTY